MLKKSKSVKEIQPLNLKVVIPTFILYLFLSEKIIAGVTGGGIKE